MSKVYKIVQRRNGELRSIYHDSGPRSFKYSVGKVTKTNRQPMFAYGNRRVAIRELKSWRRSMSKDRFTKYKFSLYVCEAIEDVGVTPFKKSFKGIEGCESVVFCSEVTLISKVHA